ncbi:hypothetical protein PLCT2_02036 [Planctomycetaceae bacterium]|nr:hypothetical protein PLCT2_02036 [Planctomycetaceae bacterium]
MVLIPIGTSHSASIEGARLKEVCCEHCRCEYVYFAHRTGQGLGFAPLFLFQGAAENSAEKAAYERLQKALDKAVDIAPCPQCGRVQDFMVRAKRVAIWQVTAATAFVFLLPVLLFSAFGVGKSHVPDTASRIAIGIVPEVAILAAIGCATSMIFSPNDGCYFPFFRKSVQPTMTADGYRAQLAAEHEQQQKELAERGEQIRQNKERMEAENAVKRERAKARKEEEARKTAERARALTHKPQA